MSSFTMVHAVVASLATLFKLVLKTTFTAVKFQASANNKANRVLQLKKQIACGNLQYHPSHLLLS